jgi:hypothetical protein
MSNEWRRYMRREPFTGKARLFQNAEFRGTGRNGTELQQRKQAYLLVQPSIFETIKFREPIIGALVQYRVAFIFTEHAPMTTGSCTVLL